jgi:hypothetical protein
MDANNEGNGIVTSGFSTGFLGSSDIVATATDMTGREKPEGTDVAKALLFSLCIDQEFACLHRDVWQAKVHLVLRGISAAKKR